MGRPMLSDASIRAGWETQREDIRKQLLSRGFNKNSLDRAATNFIESMVFAKIPCTKPEAIKAAAKQYVRECECPH